MMKEIQYKTFSLKAHKKNWQIKRPNVCQFELTFGCALNCNYCYTSCYNKPGYIKNELDSAEIKNILDKVYDAGVIWVCFTGGDPLTRKDFLDIYSYAKEKGFIITIFTNGYSMSKEIADYFKKRPPFVIEMTLNGATRETYEGISGIKDSFEMTMKGINLILERNLPLKIKTQVIKDNLEELPKIKQFIKNLGLIFRPSVFLHSRLNGDLSPCAFRIEPEEILSLNGEKEAVKDECKLSLHAAGSTLHAARCTLHAPRSTLPHAHLFRCAIGGGDGIYIDPYGNIVPCDCIREPKLNLLKEDINKAKKVILDWVRSRVFVSNSKCKSCSIREFCYSCPGKALLEADSLEEPVEWFCELARHTLQASGSTLHASGSTLYAK